MIEGSSSGVPGTGGDGNFGAGGSSGSGGAVVEGTGGVVTDGGAGTGGSDGTGGTTMAPPDGSADQQSDGFIPTNGPPPAIDYSIWQLQLPTGSGTSPTTVGAIELPTFSNLYFYKADDGGQIFMDPVTGITTTNSVHPRTELREMAPGGGGAAWSASGTNTMTVKGKVLKGSSVTIAQVFNGPSSITLAELQYSSGGFTLFYEEARGQGGSTGLGNAVPLNTPYTFTMSLTKNILTVSINGKSVFTRTPSAGTLGSKFYFKVGNYDQTTSKGAISTTARSTVEVYSAAVVHQ
jgi:hypothetical protein